MLLSVGLGAERTRALESPCLLRGFFPRWDEGPLVPPFFPVVPVAGEACAEEAVASTRARTTRTTFITRLLVRRLSCWHYDNSFLTKRQQRLGLAYVHDVEIQPPRSGQRREQDPRTQPLRPACTPPELPWTLLPKSSCPAPLSGSTSVSSASPAATAPVAVAPAPGRRVSLHLLLRHESIL